MMERNIKKLFFVIILLLLFLLAVGIKYINSHRQLKTPIQKVFSFPTPTRVIPTINPCNLTSREDSYIPCKLYIVFNPAMVNQETKESTKVFISQLLQEADFENFQVMYSVSDQYPQAIIEVSYQQEDEVGLQLNEKYKKYILSSDRLKNPEVIGD